LNRTATALPEYDENKIEVDSFHVSPKLEEHAVYTEDHDPEPDGDWTSTERLPMFAPLQLYQKVMPEMTEVSMEGLVR
jgi:hypothetical protein